ncbi:MAG: DHH family phosphoesterase, partial [Lachnospiraceae bacterium]|nr:DHH family phosphoesterase [Lachnospiraceae bacterium]
MSEINGDSRNKIGKGNMNVTGFLRLYLQWPIIMAIILVVLNIIMLIYDRSTGLFMAVIDVVLVIISLIIYFYGRGRITIDLIRFATRYGSVQENLLKELEIPYAILMFDGTIIWSNNAFLCLLDADEKTINHQKNIKDIFPEITSNEIPRKMGGESVIELDYNKKRLRTRISLVSIENLNDDEKLLQLPANKEFFVAVYFEDITEATNALKQAENERMVSGLIYIDNYDEVAETTEEGRLSLLFAIVDTKINQYFSKVHGIVKRMENDKYFVVLKYKNFKVIEDDKFSILDEIKDIKNVGNRIPVTISIGLGYSGKSYTEAYDFARASIEQALARGGDQAVIKNNNDIYYYGGKQEQTAKSTRVKARVKAEALQELITLRDRIYIMGHQTPDVDCFGGAIGIYRACMTLEKEAHIVLDEFPSTIKNLVTFYQESHEYPEDLFVNKEYALKNAKPSDLLVVVDTSRPKMTECSELLDLIDTIAVIDHHRQSPDAISNSTLSYIETYASSSSEMVSEILQYVKGGIKIPKLEATSLYAGIMIDTNNFHNRTGVRTFEAAAFLRRYGADLTLLRKLFRDDMDSYRAKAEIISSAENYHGIFAIANGSNLMVESPTIIGAQAADELLDIVGVKASFVLTEYGGKIYVSARSIDSINVQLIMEHIGGGGHM